MELPTIEGLALKLGVNDDTLVEWANKHEDFNEVYKRLKMSQKVQLINGGAFGGKEVNASMFIFLLKANHNMIETERKELVGKDGEPIKINIVNDYLASSGWVTTASKGNTQGSDTVQNTGVAPESTENIDSTGKDSPGSV